MANVRRGGQQVAVAKEKWSERRESLALARYDMQMEWRQKGG